MSFKITPEYTDYIFRELEGMKSARKELDSFDRVAYARGLACLTAFEHFTETIIGLRNLGEGAFRPTAAEFADIVRTAAGITDLDQLPPIQQAIYRRDGSRAAEEARVQAEQEARQEREMRAARLIESTDGQIDPYAGDEDGRELKLPPLLWTQGGRRETCRERARRVVHGLATRPGKRGPLAETLVEETPL